MFFARACSIIAGERSIPVLIRAFWQKRRARQTRAAAQIEHVRKNLARRRSFHCVKQNLRAAIGELFDQMAVELRRILVKQGLDISPWRRRGHGPRAKRRQPQSGPQRVAVIERQRLAVGFHSFFATAEGLEGLRQRIPAGRPGGSQLQRLSEKIAGSIEIPAFGGADAPLIAAVGGQVAGTGRNGEGHAFAVMMGFLTPAS